MLDPKTTNPLADMRTRAGAIRAAGSLEQALDKGLQKVIEVTLSEALVLGLLKQGVRKYFAIFGHGSTDLGNVLRVYEEEGVTRTINCRNEVEPRRSPHRPPERVSAVAAGMIAKATKVAIKAGGGTRGHDAAVRRMAEAAGAAVILSPGSTGVLPDAHAQNMHVGGSKGSISGNFAMAEADLLIVVGSRAVCQADCSGIGYKRAHAVININGDLADALHYNKTVALVGDIGAVAGRLADKLEALKANGNKGPWLKACAAKKAEWSAYKQKRYACGPLRDEAWQKPVLTQPAAIKLVADFAKEIGAAKFFDAGDVQANGFQIVEDERTGDTFTEAGASYMGFAASALLGAALAEKPRYGIAFCGDGSFMMNPQILVDAVEHRVRGMIVIFDNRRMAAITGLQMAQYQAEFRTNDHVAVDYKTIAGAVSGVLAVSGGDSADALRSALRTASKHDGLSVVHVPVYCGPDELGGLGAWGEWNVGNWCEDVQGAWIRQDL
jgi:3D-(3,5/4)-trihydroxycyclohexane-1,2-dione acylhydrolase (decyclizing)